MTPRARRNRRTRSRSRRRGDAPDVILVFGESENDSRSIRELIEALRPELTNRVRTLREPLVLMKDAPLDQLPARAEQIAAVVRATGAQARVLCVFAHEDADALLEDAHVELCERIERNLRNAGCPAHAVVPAWELEAWWFQWPEAVKKVRASWRAPDDFLGRDVGKIRNAKEELKKRVVPTTLKPEKRNSFPHYSESDSPLIAQYVKALGLADKPGAKSRSYARFVDSVRACSTNE